jgi:DNA polymerase delta subunit 3
MPKEVQLLIHTRMLYEFHKQQNAKKPESIHATYLLSGTKRKEEPTNGDTKKDNDGDNYMQSSQIMSSSMPVPEEDHSTASPPVLSITLVREEDLESMLGVFAHYPTES